MEPKELLRQYREAGREALGAQVSPATINEEQRTLDIVWFTGVDVPRYDWWTGTSYTLRFDPKGCDLSNLNNGAPVCDNHWMESVEDQKGVVEKAWVDGTDYKATLRFKRSTDLTGPRCDLDGLWQDIKDGIVTKFSMGVEILEAIEQRDKDNKLQVRTATRWRPFELSLAPIPADFGTTTLSAENPVSVNLSSHRAREIEIMRLR